MEAADVNICRISFSGLNRVKNLWGWLGSEHQLTNERTNEPINQPTNPALGLRGRIFTWWGREVVYLVVWYQPSMPIPFFLILASVSVPTGMILAFSQETYQKCMCYRAMVVLRLPCAVDWTLKSPWAHLGVVGTLRCINYLVWY